MRPPVPVCPPGLLSTGLVHKGLERCLMGGAVSAGLKQSGGMNKVGGEEGSTLDRRWHRQRPRVTSKHDVAQGRQ